MTVPVLNLNGKVAVITGGRRGIGRAIALTMAEAGADVVVCDRVAEGGELESVAKEIQGLGQRSLALSADITRKADVENLVQRVVSEFGAIDILVNNAATNILSTLLDLGEDGWDRVINTDLKGYYLCCQAAGKYMVEKKRGVIINMASTAAMKAAEKMGVYCIAKAGVVMLTRVLALEMAPFNIRVNAIAPYMVETKFSQPLWNDPAVRGQIEAEVPLNRLAVPEDIAGAALFLASDVSSYITGHTMIVDGGLSA